MLLVDVHELDVVFGHAVALGGFEREVDDVWGVFGLDGEDVFVLGAAENLTREISAVRLETAGY